MGLSTFDAFKHLVASDAIEIGAEDLRRLQNILAGIVDDIAAVCEANGIEYSLGGGTALGARRHGGFIPWDDDVDINFARAEYDRFIPLFRERFGHKYWIHGPGLVKDYPLAFGRIRLKGTLFKTREDLLGDGLECGAFVDLFVIENTFNNRFLRNLHGFGSLALGFLYSCRKFYRERKLILGWASENASMGGVFRLKLAVGFLAAVLPMGFWTCLWDWWNRLCRDGNSRYVTVPVGRRHFFGELALRDGFCATRRMAWEGRMRPVAKDIDGYMVRLYGPDFMTPPPETEREKHVVWGLEV